MSMAEIASHELGHDMAAVLRRVQEGDQVVITVEGRAVARLVPVDAGRRRWIARAELVRRLGMAQADPVFVRVSRCWLVRQLRVAPSDGGGAERMDTGGGGYRRYRASMRDIPGATLSRVHI
jgi:prevent-host-death family protein